MGVLYLYPSNQTDFSTNGEVVNYVFDDIVTRDEGFKLTFKVQLDNGGAYRRLKKEAIIQAMTPDGPNYFRIYDVRKSSNYVEIVALQLMYDLNNRQIHPFQVKNTAGSQAFHIFTTKFKSGSTPFGISSTINETHDFSTDDDLENLEKGHNALEIFNRMVRRWGGKLIVDGFGIRVVPSIGRKTNVLLYERKNIASFEEESSTRDLVTRIHAHCEFQPERQEGQEEEPPPVSFSVVVDSPLIDLYSQVYERDLTNNDCRTEQELIDWAETHFTYDHMDIPSRSIKVDPIISDGTPIGYGDELVLKYLAHDIDTTIECIGYEYCPTGEHYISLLMGEPSRTFYNVITDISGHQIQQNQGKIKKIAEQVIMSAGNGINRMTSGPSPVPNPINGDIWFYHPDGRPSEIEQRIYKDGSWRKADTPKEIKNRLDEANAKLEEAKNALDLEIASLGGRVSQSEAALLNARAIATQATQAAETAQALIGDIQQDLLQHRSDYTNFTQTVDGKLGQIENRFSQVATKVELGGYVQTGQFNNLLINSEGFQTEITSIRRDIPKRIGRRNILTHEYLGLRSKTYPLVSIPLSIKPEPGQKYTLAVEGDIIPGQTIRVCNSGYSVTLLVFSYSDRDPETGFYVKTFTWVDQQGSSTATNTFINLFLMSGPSVDVNIKRIKLEEGSIFSGWDDEVIDVGENLMLRSKECYTSNINGVTYESTSDKNIPSHYPVADAKRLKGTARKSSGYSLVTTIPRLDNADPYYMKNEMYSQSLWVWNHGSKPIYIYPNVGNHWVEIPPGKLHHYAVSFRTGNYLSAMQINIYVRDEVEDVAFDFTIWHPKTEVGNRVTAYSPSPRDLDKTINEVTASVHTLTQKSNLLESRFTQVQNTQSSQATSISTLTQDANSIRNRLSSAESNLMTNRTMISSVEQTVARHLTRIQTVESSLVTKASINKVSEVEQSLNQYKNFIGTSVGDVSQKFGQMLLTNQQFLAEVRHDKGQNRYTGTRNFDGPDWAPPADWQKSLVWTPWGTLYKGCKVLYTKDYHNGKWQNIEVKKGDKVTFTCTVYVPTNTKVHILGIWQGAPLPATAPFAQLDKLSEQHEILAGGWRTISTTFTVQESGSMQPRVEKRASDNQPNNYIYVTQIMVEIAETPRKVWEESPDEHIAARIGASLRLVENAVFGNTGLIHGFVSTPNLATIKADRINLDGNVSMTSAFIGKVLTGQLVADHINAFAANFGSIIVNHVAAHSVSAKVAEFLSAGFPALNSRASIDGRAIRINSNSGGYAEMNALPEFRSVGQDQKAVVLGQGRLQFFDAGGSRGYVGIDLHTGTNKIGFYISRGVGEFGFYYPETPHNSQYRPMRYRTVNGGNWSQLITDEAVHRWGVHHTTQQWINLKQEIWNMNGIQSDNPTIPHGTQLVVEQEYVPSTNTQQFVYKQAFIVGRSTGGDMRIYSRLQHRFTAPATFEQGFQNQSDSRLKYDILPTSIGALDHISALKFKEYRYRSNNRREVLGLIAQDSGILRVIDGDEMESVDIVRLGMLATKGVQELLQRVIYLEERMGMNDSTEHQL